MRITNQSHSPSDQRVEACNGVSRSEEEVADGWLASTIRSRFFRDLVRKTKNFGSVTWLGQPIWQNVLDLWTIQETIAEVRPRLLIETGTNRGGSSLFYANLFDL